MNEILPMKEALIRMFCYYDLPISIFEGTIDRFVNEVNDIVNGIAKDIINGSGELSEVRGIYE